MIQVLNPGGMVWESREGYASIDEALAEADQVIAEELAWY